MFDTEDNMLCSNVGKLINQYVCFTMRYANFDTFLNNASMLPFDLISRPTTDLAICFYLLSSSFTSTSGDYTIRLLIGIKSFHFLTKRVLAL